MGGSVTLDDVSMTGVVTSCETSSGPRLDRVISSSLGPALTGALDSLTATLTGVLGLERRVGSAKATLALGRSSSPPETSDDVANKAAGQFSDVLPSPALMTSTWGRDTKGISKLPLMQLILP